MALAAWGFAGARATEQTKIVTEINQHIEISCTQVMQQINIVLPPTE